MMKLHIHLNERAVLVRDGRVQRALGPGHYTLWKQYDLVRFDTDKHTFAAPALVLAGLPHDWFEQVNLGPSQYAVVYRDERAIAFLRPGTHRVWKVDPSITLRVFADSDPLPARALTDEVRAAIPANELLEATIEMTQRAVLVRDGKPERVLAPGHVAFWGKGAKLVTFNVDDLVFHPQADILAMLPAAWFTTLELAAHERAAVYRAGRPLKYLRPGTHRIWTIDASVRVERFDVTGAMPELTDELRAVVPASEYVEATVRQFEKGLEYVQGKFAGTLEPGKYQFWTHPASRVTVQLIDTRVQQLKIEGQDLMTRDKVTLRLTLTAEYAPTDGPTTIHAVTDVKDALYLAVQLAAREFVTGVTLDELLEGRDGLTKYLEAQVQPRAETFGVRVHRVGVKDVILPGEMKILLNKVIEAEKSAAANVITRREDAAATRNMAQTAKVIAENPVLMRLKELETMKDIAEKIDEIKLVMGTDGFIKNLLPMANGTREN